MKIVEQRIDSDALARLKLWVVYPGKKEYPLTKNISAPSLEMIGNQVS
ncbi:MAG: hypothetical protein R6W75_13300 [Smithellaceae bacterium]